MDRTVPGSGYLRVVNFFWHYENRVRYLTVPYKYLGMGRPFSLVKWRKIPPVAVPYHFYAGPDPSLVTK